MNKISTCQICSSTFTHGPSSKGLYCSRSCSVKGVGIRNRLRNSRLRQEKLITNPRYCSQCQSVLTANHHKKFCSKSCAATYNNTIRPKRQRQSPRDLVCLTCSKTINCRGRIYCSRTCSAIASQNRPHKRKKEFISCRCKHENCGVVWESKKYAKYCSQHSHLYSHNERARYWFTINVYKFPELFDIDSLTKIGFRSSTNPNGYTRDHRVSVNEAINNGYDPYYITHVMNCELMLWQENNKKKTRSSITYEELKTRVHEYDSKQQLLRSMVQAVGFEPTKMDEL